MWWQWIFTGIGCILALGGFLFMIRTQREQQKTWSRLLQEDAEKATERYQELQKTTFGKKTRLSLFLILAGMAMGIIALLIEG